ncbi:sugar transporter [Ignatzschineria rhizosphaerae]|uniref:Sugar transporter n=1 Tax=Ignatzschineria rhizosphaerae TaxID=2923279 RepID=A0ABY3X175_9GAMM|nr:sugar transporter [Ignatzschineria rhizosphaerae]UNM96627.1 sugar transporter [Ignatzschineria rhizosphaerae]
MQTSQDNQQFNLAWLRVIVLAIAGFVFNTTEFIPIALLTDIGASFELSAAKVGIMITIYAWVVALASLPLMLLVSSFERKSLLTIVFIIFIVSHIATFFANSFSMLIVGRIGVALSHAIFWSITAALAIRVAPLGKKSQALGILATGTALATVLGIPLGRIIGQLVGWRYTFLLIGLVALITLIVLYLILPRLPSQNAGNAKSIPLILKRPALLGIFFITMLVVTAHFTAYSYIEPFSETIAQLSPNKTTVLLLIFGGAGILGSYIFSKKNNQYPLAFLPVMIVLLSLSLLLIFPSTYLHNGLLFLAILWGVSMTGIALALQLKVLELAPDATDIAMAIFSGIFNIGIGGGALVGTIIIEKIGLHYISFAAFFIALLALLLTSFCFIRYRLTFLKATHSTQEMTHH